jgi:hypothetical protein
MAQPTTTKGGRFRVLLETATPGTFAAPCGFLSKSLTLTKGLEEVLLPDCDDPDMVPWAGQDATSLSMGISGEGVLAAESVETWLDAWESPESVNAKIEIEFAAKTVTWTGRIQVSTLTMGHPTAQGRVTNQVEMASDGQMTRVITPAV